VAIIALVALAIAAFLVTQTLTPSIRPRRSWSASSAPSSANPRLSLASTQEDPLVQDIQRIDRRLLDYEAEEFEIIAGDQKRLVVDAYARYRIDAAKKFAQTVPGGEPSCAGCSTR
jgi:membrane protease subunit HflC